MSYRILVAEDDRGLNQGIRLALQKEELHTQDCGRREGMVPAPAA